jgi:hypothetical protein
MSAKGQRVVTVVLPEVAPDTYLRWIAFFRGRAGHA